MLSIIQRKGANELDIEDAALFVEMVAGFYFAIVTAIDAVFFMAAAAVATNTVPSTSSTVYLLS